MKNTIDDVKRIIGEIERDDASSDSAENASVIAEKLLGRKPSVSVYSNQSGLKGKIGEINNPAVWSVNVNRPLITGDGFKGKIKSIVIRAVRKMIRPVLFGIVEDQRRFNKVCVQTLNELYAQKESLEQEKDELEEKVDMLEKTLLQQGDYISEVNGEVQHLKVRERMQVTTAAEGKSDNIQVSQKNVYDIVDYESFENHFRGTQEEIRAKQEEYLPYIKKGSRVIDLGSGRGEFLELLKENGFDACGVERYEKFATDTANRGLNVVQADALEYIKQLEEESVGTITAFQVAEHLDTVQLLELIITAYEKLEKGGVLIMETPNPRCLSIYTNSFYLDSTHTKPIHPKAMEYYAEVAGFSNISTLYTKSSRVPYELPLIPEGTFGDSQKYNNGITLLSDLIWGSQDYALIAKK
ncbi:MAG: methyltransferase domain-containing protein [Lachnospiraceae bacterium]|nr:methyltransferase domain-containing protein [Lachnospiraceae bacterium]